MNQNNPRRSHLTKEQRLPQSYKEVEKILNSVKKCEANVKTVLNNSKLRGAVLHKVSGLTFSVLKQRRLLDSIIEKVQILEKEPYLRKELAGILIHELIFGNGLPGKSKPVETVLRYQVNIESAYNDLKTDESLFNSLISIPKYVRVNTLVVTLPEVLEDLEYLGVRQIVFDANISENEFYELVKNLEKNTFLLDYHFKDLLIFHGEENLSTWSLYQKGHVFIQDKSSYIPAYVLAPPPGATVIDACAAPGMKTLHLTALMENDGVVYAFERDQQRFEILKKMLKSGHANICQTSCGDFNLVDPRDEKFSSVEYILLDPSCSGSGMVSRMDYITDTNESKNDLRIQKLAGFQIILLKHALLFPSVKRVVYSTCSITETENEFVVHEVLNHFGHRFKLSPVLPDWPIRGSNDFEFGSHCLRAYPDKCFTNGFFVAMFERLDYSEEQRRFERKQHKSEKKKHLCDAEPKDFKFNNEVETFDSDFKNKNQSVEEGRKNGTTLDNLTEVVEEEMHTKKKHKKKHKNDNFASINEEHTEIQAGKVELNIEAQNDKLTSIAEETIHKKKHKSKRAKDYSKHFSERDNLISIQHLESETRDNNIQDGIFVDDVQEINSKHKKNKRKHKKDCQNTNADLGNTYIQDVILEIKPDNTKNKNKHGKDGCNYCVSDEKITQSFNVIENTSTEIASEIKMHHKKKKHKKQHEEKDPDNSFCETQNSDTQIEMSNINDNILTGTVQKVEFLQKKKKKHKKQHEKNDPDNSFCEIQNSDTQIEISNDDNILTGTVQKVGFSHKKKKEHKRKHEKEYNSLCEIQTPEVQIQHSNNDNILTEAMQKVEFSHKKKKHKRKHEREECNNSFCETLAQEIQIQNSNVETDTLTETVQVETFHKKKKHKRKHEIENY